ncbi:MAG: DUF1990 family protein [Bdellovibrio sp.]|nr:DUF1990 family protein [Bdellovibrio sp.]
MKQDTQKVDQGYGNLFHRIYSVRLPICAKAASASMDQLQQNPDQFSPQILAHFEKTKGSKTSLHVGDEFIVHIPGPWNGPVRVTEVGPNRFKLATLEGHLEAGEITFEMKNMGPNENLFQIESKAKSRDAFVDLVYDKIPIVRLAQTEMWKGFCEQFAKAALEADPNCFEEVPEVQVVTEKYNEESQQWQTL